MHNNTAGVRERKDANRTREAGHLDEVQGVVATMLDVFRNGAVGFIDWLDDLRGITQHRLSLVEGSADFESADEANRARW